jgi:Zn-dependent metalloprotease
MRAFRTAAAGTGIAVLAALLLTPATATASPDDGLAVVATRHSLLGTHTWYQQTFGGLPVLGGYYVRHVDRTGQVTVDDGRVPVPDSLRLAPDVSGTGAESTATRTLATAAARQAPVGKSRNAPAADATQHAQLAVLGGAGARLVWRVVGTADTGSTETVVDADTGAVVSQRSLVKNETGQGKVFSPNPVVALRNENLKDKHDADQAILRPAYKIVPLRYLNGRGTTLRGRYVRIMNANVATSRTGKFLYTRHNDRFEQVSAYYDINQSQKYLRSLGFTGVNTDSQKVKTDTIPDDNSYYDPSVDMITFGRGGVDDAEDEEVVWHELGHAIQDSQVPGFGDSEQGGAIGEGFGDYWAVTMSQPVSDGFDLPCVMDWDATSYTSGPSHCLRRTDGPKTTDDIDGEVHDDGEIWSRALWDIHLALGRRAADKVIIESQFGYSPNTSFAQAARHVVQTARLLSGDAAAAQVRTAFVDRKILG